MKAITIKTTRRGTVIGDIVKMSSGYFFVTEVGEGLNPYMPTEFKVIPISLSKWKWIRWFQLGILSSIFSPKIKTHDNH